MEKNELVICSSYLGLVTKMFKHLWYCGDFPCAPGAHVVKKTFTPIRTIPH